MTSKPLLWSASQVRFAFDYSRAVRNVYIGSIYTVAAGKKKFFEGRRDAVPIGAGMQSAQSTAPTSQGIQNQKVLNRRAGRGTVMQT